MKNYTIQLAVALFLLLPFLVEAQTKEEGEQTEVSRFYKKLK